MRIQSAVELPGLPEPAAASAESSGDPGLFARLLQAPAGSGEAAADTGATAAGVTVPSAVTPAPAAATAASVAVPVAAVAAPVTSAVANADDTAALTLALTFDQTLPAIATTNAAATPIAAAPDLIAADMIAADDTARAPAAMPALPTPAAEKEATAATPASSVPAGGTRLLQRRTEEAATTPTRPAARKPTPQDDKTDTDIATGLPQLQPAPLRDDDNNAATAAPASDIAADTTTAAPATPTMTAATTDATALQPITPAPVTVATDAAAACTITLTATDDPQQPGGSRRGSAMPAAGKSLPQALRQTANHTDDNDKPKNTDDAGPAWLTASQGQSLTAATADAIVTAARTPATAGDNLMTTAALTAAPADARSTASTSAAAPATTATTSPQGQAAAQLLSTYAPGSDGFGTETVHHIRWMKDHDRQSAELQLHPADLGRVSISIDIRDGQASVQLVAHNGEARELLERSLPQLRQLLAQNGMTLADSQVSQQQQRDNRQYRQLPELFRLHDSAVPDLMATRPAAFRQSGGSHRIDHYV